MSNKPHFEAPTMDADLGRLNEQQIKDQQTFTFRANAHYEYVKRNGHWHGR